MRRVDGNPEGEEPVGYAGRLAPGQPAIEAAPNTEPGVGVAGVTSAVDDGAAERRREPDGTRGRRRHPVGQRSPRPAHVAADPDTATADSGVQPVARTVIGEVLHPTGHGGCRVDRLEIADVVELRARCRTDATHPCAARTDVDAAATSARSSSAVPFAAACRCVSGACRAPAARSSPPPVVKLAAGRARCSTDDCPLLVETAPAAAAKAVAVATVRTMP